MIIGIDPGKSGAICVRWNDLRGVEHAEFVDIPTDKSKKHGYDINGINSVLRNTVDTYKRSANRWYVVVIEEPAGMAFMGGGGSGTEYRYDSPKTSFEKGYGLGVLDAVIELLDVENITVIRVRPADWKRKLGLTNGKLTYSQKKKMALDMARNEYPEYRIWLERVKDSDRAEALLLTHYALRMNLNYLE